MKNNMTLDVCLGLRQKGPVVLCLFLLAAVILLNGCSKPARTKDLSQCTPDVKLSSFWTDLKLPNVDGAVLCRDYTSGDKKTAEFVHYRKDQEHYADFAETWMQAFKRSGWTVGPVDPGDTYVILPVTKNQLKLNATFRDCDFQKSDERLCSVVKISEGK